MIPTPPHDHVIGGHCRARVFCSAYARGAFNTSQAPTPFPGSWEDPRRRDRPLKALCSALRRGTLRRREIQ